MASIYDSLVHQNIQVYRPGELEYERSVANANLLYRYSRPSYVVQPTHTSQVQIIVNEAQADGTRLTIKNGGHSYAGFSTANNGILLDLVKMNDVHLDLNPRDGPETVTVQGGALWGHAYKKLINGRLDGRMINGGRCPTVGATGFTLGGGLGPFTRSLGMGCDTLISATVVTADGQLVTVKNTDDPKGHNGRLFWALRGAGGGNFGVVVKMKMRVEKLKSPIVVAGRFTWSPEKKSDTDQKESSVQKEAETKPTDKEEDLVQTMNAFYAANWSKEMTIDSSWLCDLKETKTDIAVRFLVYYDGSEDDFDAEVDAKLGAHTHLAKQLKRRTLPEPSTRFLHETLVSQWSEEIQKSFPTNRTFSLYTSFSFAFGKDKETDDDIDKKSISEITAIIEKEMKVFRTLFPGETGLLQVTWIHTGGRAKEPLERPGENKETAFPWREADYHAYIMLQWEEKFLEKDMRGFLERFKVQLRQYAIGGEAAFINFPDETLHKQDAEAPEKAYFGPSADELRQVKQIWDKDDFFHWHQGVRLPEKTQPPPGVASNSATLVKHSRMAQNVSYEEVAAPVYRREVLTAVRDDAVPEPAISEKVLTDAIASAEWQNLGRDVALITNTEFTGGVHSITDLGF